MNRQLLIALLFVVAVAFAPNSSAADVSWAHDCDDHSFTNENAPQGVDPDHNVDTDNECTGSCSYEVEINKPGGSIVLGYYVAFDTNGTWAVLLMCAGGTERVCANATFAEGSFSEGFTCHYGDPSDPSYGINEISC